MNARKGGYRRANFPGLPANPSISSITNNCMWTINGTLFLISIHLYIIANQ